MFSPRFFAVFAILLAVTAALPTDKPAIPKPVTIITDDDFEEQPWITFPLFGNLFAPLWRLFPTIADIGPKIVADKDKFQVIVNVKDYNKDDLKVKVKNDFIFVQGTHEAKQDDKDMFASQFFHTYTLPTNSSADDVKSELYSDGYLVVTALTNNPVNRAQETDRTVPIVETGVPYKKEETTTETPVTAVTSVTSSPAAVSEKEEDRKEPTTPSTLEREENLTEKDNSIPHGNEVTP